MNEHAPEVKILMRVHEAMVRHRGQGFFEHVVTVLAELLNIPLVLLGRCEEGREQLRILSLYRNGLVECGGTLPIPGTVIERILDEGHPYGCRQKAWMLFPQDEILQTWKAESCWGVPLVSHRNGEVLGVLALYATEPRSLTRAESAMVDVIGSCVAGELERSLQEEAIQELRRRLLHAQRMESLGALTAGVAHDFNNLLTGILGFTELALTHLGPAQGDTDEIALCLRQVLTLSRRARDLVQHLLLLSRPEGASKRPCSMHALLRDFAAVLRRMIPENIEMELELAPGEIIVDVEATHFQQVLLNLVVNARDAMPQGGRLRLHTKRIVPEVFPVPSRTRVHSRPYACLTISDTGTGIAPDILPRIFEPFFTTKEAGRGTGLGLAIVQEIVHSYEGWIEVESEPGRGTSFHIFWPIAEESSTDAEAEEEDKVPQGGGETLLVIEDDPVILKLGRELLERLGYRVLTAQRGPEALEVYARHREDIRLVLLDIVLPEMSGEQVLRELRRIAPEVRILVMTGYGSKDRLADFPWEMADGLLLKPYDIRSLAQAVRRCLDGGASIS
jgi:signal transduction histidine kinase/CheY-like chemotaxis protein